MMALITLMAVKIPRFFAWIVTDSRNCMAKNAGIAVPELRFSDCKDKNISFHLYFLNFAKILRNVVGSKNKLKRFKENETFENVFQPTREEVVGDLFPLKGKWNSDFFKNDNPLVLELGCGKGEYSVGLAEKYPNKNFVGIDIKGARFWRGAKTAVDTGLHNVAFIRTQIELVDHIFAENEVDEIWITFPDPQIKYKRTKHRMTNSEFLQLYKKILKPDGVMNLKTDSEFMHGYTLGLLHGEGHEVLYANHNVYVNEGSPEEVTAIQTFYEKQYLEINKAITYIRFKIK